MPHYKNNRKKKFNKPDSRPKAPKYDGPIIGTAEWHAYKNIQNDREPFQSEYECPPECLPVTISLGNPEDKKFKYLQQKMMDFGWRLNEKDGFVYFTHPTYNGEEFIVYNHTLTNGDLCRIPLVNRDNDSKGLGCTITIHHGFVNIDSNEWQSYWNTRTGKRRGRYLDYLSRRQAKRDQYIEMSKIDKSSMVWYKDTPRCDPRLDDTPKISDSWSKTLIEY